MRGLIGGSCVFLIALRMRATEPRVLVRLIVASTSALAVVVFAFAVCIVVWHAI